MVKEEISDSEQSPATQKVKFSDEMGDVGDGVHPKNVNMPKPLRGLEWALTILDWDDEEIATALCSIKNFHWLKTITQLILENKEGWSLGMTGEIMCLKHWMTNYLKDPRGSIESINQVFCTSLWRIHQNQEMAAKAQQGQQPQPQIQVQQVAAPSNNPYDALNFSYHVETKEIPKLPANKSLKGKIFDDWHTVFTTKMDQVQVA